MNCELHSRMQFTFELRITNFELRTKIRLPINPRMQYSIAYRKQGTLLGGKHRHLLKRYEKHLLDFYSWNYKYKFNLCCSFFCIQTYNTLVLSLIKNLLRKYVCNKINDNTSYPLSLYTAAMNLKTAAKISKYLNFILGIHWYVVLIYWFSLDKLFRKLLLVELLRMEGWEICRTKIFRAVFIWNNLLKLT